MSLSKNLLAIALFAVGIADASAQSIQVLASDQPALSLVGSGMTYRPGPSGTFIANIETDGFLFCANVGASAGHTTISFAPKHGTWNLGSTADIGALTYGNNGTVVRVNQLADGTIVNSSLACYARGASGSLFSPYAGGVYYHGFDANYPGDASTNNVRAWVYGDDGSSTYSAPIMATQIYNDSVSHQNVFAYAFEFHGDANPGIFNGNVTAVPLRLRSEFDTAYFGTKSTGTYCVLAVPPITPLNLETACPADNRTKPLLNDGVLDFGQAEGFPALGQFVNPITLYMVVRRVLAVDPATLPTDQPIVAAAIFVDPTVDEQYTGDNVLFGYAPSVSQAPASIPKNKKH